MITKLFTEVSDLVAKEYDRAEKQHGSTFNSAHEGYAVVKEELEETREEVILTEINLDHYWESVKTNNEEAQRDCLVRLFTKAKLTACEAIQTAAMAHKALVTMDNTGQKKQQGEF